MKKPLETFFENLFEHIFEDITRLDAKATKKINFLTPTTNLNQNV